MSSNITITRKCEYCKSPFEARTLYTRYCSKTCNSRDYKNKIRENRIAVATLKKSPIQVVQDQLNLGDIPNKPYLNTSEAASYLGVSKRTIERLISSGQIKVVKLLRRVLITKQTLDNL
jgi:excisionase family DNA binding protein